MAGGTLTALSADPGVELFYSFKISGIPYQFFCVKNPTSTEYGTAAWTLASGYTAVMGMAEPDEDLTQELTDIIGGIASAETLKVNIVDFDAYDANGRYQVLSRIFAPGIATSVPNGYFELASDIPCNAAAGSFVSLRSRTYTPATGYYTVGQETLQLGSFGAPVGGVSTGQIMGGRNRYPCSAQFPPIPYHRIVRDETNGPALGKNILVTPVGTPFTMEGRSAAFYVHAMQGVGASSRPLPESEGMLVMVGRIRSYGFGPASGNAASYEIEIVSIIDELSGAALAPGLATASIRPNQICLPSPASYSLNTQNDPLWMRLSYGKKDGGRFASLKDVVINGGVHGTFDILKLQKLINKELAQLKYLDGSNFGASWKRPWLTSVGNGDQQFMSFRWNARADSTGGDHALAIWDCQLMRALGFEFSQNDSSGMISLSSPVDSGSGGDIWMEAKANKPIPSVVIPMSDKAALGVPTFFATRQGGSVSSTFVLDDGSGAANVQFGDKSIVSLTAQSSSSAGISMTTGGVVRYATGDAPGPGVGDQYKLYYVPIGAMATVRQVVIAGDRKAPSDVGQMIARFLASHDQANAIDDVNYYAEGIGLGWNQTIDRSSFLAITSLGKAYPREIIVNNTTVMKDFLTPILKEHGVAIVWDPETALVSARSLRTPAAPGSHVVILSDSNRTTTEDQTSHRNDAANVRSSWTLAWGWDAVSEQFMAPETTQVDNVVQSSGQGNKNEKIEDKTLVMTAGTNGFDLLDNLIYGRSLLTQQSWRRCTRTINRAGFHLAPGGYHQIVDNTISNPFTGKLGITAADGLYALMFSVSRNPWKFSAGKCTFLISRTQRAGFIRKWSPSGLVDFTASGNGYNTGTGVLTMARRYVSDQTRYDGYNFVVGDKVALIAWDRPEDGTGYSQTGLTISALSADGLSVTVASGLTAPTVEVLLVLDTYAANTALRKNTVAFQGDSSAGTIGGIDANVRWG